MFVACIVGHKNCIGPLGDVGAEEWRCNSCTHYHEMAMALVSALVVLRRERLGTHTTDCPAAKDHIAKCNLHCTLVRDAIKKAEKALYRLTF